MTSVPRIALGLEYDGSRFDGWQTQPHRRTVQDALEAALLEFTGMPVATICAGRTDAGVHATWQVASLDAPCERTLQSWVRGLNRHLPEGAAVRWARAVAADFDARRSARGRRYDYWILNDPVRSPLLHARATWWHRPLSEARMRAGAQHLVGTHDFSSFRSSECQALTPERSVHSVEVERRGRLLRVRIRANAFLHHMVRNIAGALLLVGQGRKDAEWVGVLLEARDRRLGAATAPAAGLYLTGVEYDDRFGLPAVLEPGEPIPWNGPGSSSAD
jgi:tRNA pseudouridine38-40 synthase